MEKEKTMAEAYMWLKEHTDGLEDTIYNEIINRVHSLCEYDRKDTTTWVYEFKDGSCVYSDNASTWDAESLDALVEELVRVSGISEIHFPACFSDLPDWYKKFSARVAVYLGIYQVEA